MPKVPVYNRQVQQGRLPQARLGLRVDAQDISGGLDKAAGAIADVAYRQAQQEREQTRSARLMDAYAQIGQARLNIESTVKEHYQGKAALESDLEAQTAEMLKREADRISEGLADDEMRNDFRRSYLREVDGLRTNMVGHVLAQGEKYAESSYKATLAIAASKAAAAGGAGRDALAGREETLAAVEQRAQLKGWSPQVVEAERRGALTDLHKGVIESLQAQPDGGASLADAYLTFHEKEMDGTIVAGLRKTLQPAALADRAEIEVKKIEAEHPNDPKARTAAVLVLPGELGAKARQVLREREAMAEEAASDAQKTHLGSVFDAIEKGAVRTESQLEKHPSFGKLVDEGPARAREYFRQLQQAERTVRAAERQAIAAADDSARKDFEARPLRERAEMDVRGEYGGRVSTDGLNVIRKVQQGAKRDWDKDRGVSESEFRRMIATETHRACPGSRRRRTSPSSRRTSDASAGSGSTTRRTWARSRRGRRSPAGSPRPSRTSRCPGIRRTGRASGRPRIARRPRRSSRTCSVAGPPRPARPPPPRPPPRRRRRC